MRIGDGGSATERPHYVTPAEELHGAVLEAVTEANIVTQMALADALQARTPWQRLPASVRALFESVADAMGISDP
jgi:hypothetical protein